MPEEILKVELAELLKAVRFKKANGVVLEAGSIDAIRDCCRDLRGSEGEIVQALFDLINAADKITATGYPIRVEFAVKVR